MNFDLTTVRDTSAAMAPIAMRQHAIYLDAQRSDRRIQKARNVADLLERGHRVRSGERTALLVDVMA